MNEIHGMYVLCGLLVAIVFSGENGGNVNPSTRLGQIGKKTRDETVTVGTLKQILEAFNRHDLDAIMEFFADDCSFDFPRGPEPVPRGKPRRRRARFCSPPRGKPRGIRPVMPSLVRK
jgi:hypothetical protein